MSADKKTDANPGPAAGTKNIKAETPAALSPLSEAASKPLTASSQPLAASPATFSGSGTGALRPAATPIQPTTSAGGGPDARSLDIQCALSGQHDYSWYTDNFHLAKANNIIAADNAERRERQRSASLVAYPEPTKDERKVKTGVSVLNLENKKPVSLS